MSHNLGISVRPELSIFKSSNSASFAKGKSHFYTLAKTIKRTEKYARIRGEKEIIAKADNAENKLIKLKLKLEELQDNLRDADDNAAKLATLYALEIINANGKPINNSMN